MANLFTKLLMSAFVLATVAQASTCDCSYHSGGCVISRSPKTGFLCKCVYKGAWTCTGYDIGCDSGSTSDCCKADAPESTRMSHDCCKDGHGDCGGYHGVANTTVEITVV
jgi:hypothetical protein